MDSNNNKNNNNINNKNKNNNEPLPQYTMDQALQQKTGTGLTQHCLVGSRAELNMLPSYKNPSRFFNGVS